MLRFRVKLEPLPWKPRTRLDIPGRRSNRILGDIEQCASSDQNCQHVWAHVFVSWIRRHPARTSRFHEFLALSFWIPTKSGQILWRSVVISRDQILEEYLRNLILIRTSFQLFLSVRQWTAIAVSTNSLLSVGWRRNHLKDSKGRGKVTHRATIDLFPRME